MDMVIEGEKNLGLLKKALESHMVSLSRKSLSATDKEVKEKWDPELDETNKMLEAVIFNLQQFMEEDAPIALSASSRALPPEGGRNQPAHMDGKSETEFFR